MTKRIRTPAAGSDYVPDLVAPWVKIRLQSGTDQRLSSMSLFQCNFLDRKAVRQIVTILMVISVAVSGIVYYELHSPLRNAIFMFSVLVLVALFVGRCRLDATPSVRLLSAVFVFYVFGAAVSRAIVGFSREAIDSLENCSHFLAGAFLLPFLVRLRPSYACLLVAVGMASFANGLYAIWELAEFGFEHRAAGSKGKAIPFGGISMLVAMLSILGGVYWSSVDWCRSLLLFSAAAWGIFASIASATRGAWIFFPVGVAVCVVYLIQRHIGYRLRTGGAALAICAVLLFALSQTDPISERIETTSSEITVILSSGTDTPDATSIIERRDMWRAVLTAFTEHPPTGHWSRPNERVLQRGTCCRLGVQICRTARPRIRSYPCA